MKYKISLIIFASLVFALTLPVSGAPRRSPKANVPEAHVTVISAVTATSLTIQEDKVMRSFTITPFTEINVNGQRATLADLKPGMSVTFTMADPTKLSRINAGPAPVTTPSK